VHAAVAHVHAIDDGITKRPAALDNSPAHAIYLGSASAARQQTKALALEHATVQVTRVEERCVEAETVEEAREPMPASMVQHETKHKRMRPTGCRL
jgi:hypothetical protein